MLTYTGLRKAAAWSVAGTAALALAVVVFAPASAQSALQRLTALTCNDPQSCLSIINTSPKGKAIVGVAQNSSAIVGRTNINKNTDPTNITPPNGGVYGVDASTNPLDNNAGVLGTSAHGSGVAGITTVESSFGGAGVEGFDFSNKPTDAVNAATYGQSLYNFGLWGVSVFSTGTAVFGYAANSSSGGVFETIDTLSNPSVGLAGFATYGIATIASNASSKFEALHVENLGSGPLLRGFNGSHEVMSVDNAGNMVLAGNIQTGGTPMSISSTSGGRHVVTYAARQSVPTIDDVGEAQLVHGQAVVRLEPTFASAMNARTTYLVFITPQGDTNGFLYVTQKTAAGFVVREHNGASNVAFDYRIVAQPYGSVAPRLPQYAGGRDQAAAAAELGMMRRHLRNVGRLQTRSSYLRFQH